MTRHLSSQPVAASAWKTGRSISARYSLVKKTGIREGGDKIWLAGFMNDDPGYLDLQACRVESIENPFGSKGLTTSSV
ncbi:MAG: hypothetical protein KGI54_12445 [Pseudomonadota bacterium]|nr:hypothetical protein [Pseudomonadota bacterium]